MKRLWTAKICVWTAPFLLGAQVSVGSNGTVAAPFLDLPVAARPAAMGVWGVSGVLGAGSLASNPAALARMRSLSLQFSHGMYIESTAMSNAAIAGPLGPSAGWGADVRYFAGGKVESTDASGNPAGTLSPSDAAAALGAAIRTGIGSIGFSGKYVQSKIIDTADTFTADAGYLSPPLLNKRFQAGVAATNMFGDLDFGNGPEALPRVWRVGASYDLTSVWTLVGEFSAPKAGEDYGGLGTEYRHEFGEWSTALRAGYSSRAQDAGGTSGFSLGLGLGKNRFVLDYAFVPLGDLGATHWFTFALRFAPPPAMAPTPSKPPAAKPATPKPPASPAARPKRLNIKDKR